MAVVLIQFLLAEAFIGSQYRSDVLLSQSLYPEGLNPPTGGGRVHYVLASSTKYTELKKPYTVTLVSKGQQYSILLSGGSSIPSPLNWIHCEVTRGNTVWLAFHSNDELFTSEISQVTIKDVNKKLISDIQLPALIKDYPLRITYATTFRDYRSMIVHLHNNSTRSYVIEEIYINGQAHKYSSTIDPQEHLAPQFQLNSNFREGDAWTIVVKTDTGYIGNGGRAGKEIFPIGAFPYPGDCPYPADDDRNYEIYTTIFEMSTYYLSASATCEANTLDVIEQGSQYGYLTVPEYSLNNANVPFSTVTEEILAVSISKGDDTSPENAAKTWESVELARTTLPTLMTYQGGNTTSYAGIFSGLTDIQGKEFYIAGCTNQITSFTSGTRIQSTFDYTKNTRDNQMPLPHWATTQFLGSWSVLPSGSEILVELASNIAGGAKGIFFNQVEASQSGTSESDLAFKLLKQLTFIEDDLRISDIEGAPFTMDIDSSKVLVSVLRSLDKLILVVVNINASGYNDILCTLDIGTHWSFSVVNIPTLEIQLPSDLSDLSDLKEVTDQGIVSSNLNYNIKTKTATITNLAVDKTFTSRIFLIV